MKSIYEKFRHGDNLTDDELATGAQQFSKAADSLSGLGPEFELARRECDRVARELSGFIAARAS